MAGQLEDGKGQWQMMGKRLEKVDGVALEKRNKPTFDLYKATQRHAKLAGYAFVGKSERRKGKILKFLQHRRIRNRITIKDNRPILIKARERPDGSWSLCHRENKEGHLQIALGTSGQLEWMSCSLDLVGWYICRLRRFPGRAVQVDTELTVIHLEFTWPPSLGATLGDWKSTEVAPPHRGFSTSRATGGV